MATEDEAIEDVGVPSKSFEETKEFSESPLSSPKISKQSSPTTKITSPALQATRSAGKKYVMVAKPLALPSRHVNDIENDLKQSMIGNSQIIHWMAHIRHIIQTILERWNIRISYLPQISLPMFHMPTLLYILKYLKIHERPRAATACILWNLAAKDTSFWHTVRMKNSKVCSWSGFAGALRCEFT